MRLRAATSAWSLSDLLNMHKISYKLVEWISSLAVVLGATLTFYFLYQMVAEFSLCVDRATTTAQVENCLRALSAAIDRCTIPLVVGTVMGCLGFISVHFIKKRQVRLERN